MGHAVGLLAQLALQRPDAAHMQLDPVGMTAETGGFEQGHLTLLRRKAPDGHDMEEPVVKGVGRRARGKGGVHPV